MSVFLFSVPTVLALALFIPSRLRPSGPNLPHSAVGNKLTIFAALLTQIVVLCLIKIASGMQFKRGATGVGNAVEELDTKKRKEE